MPLKEGQFEIQPDVVDLMIDQYCREPGVRSLEKQTRKLIEKIAYKNITSKQKISVDASNLTEYLG